MSECSLLNITEDKKDVVQKLNNDGLSKVEESEKNFKGSKGDGNGKRITSAFAKFDSSISGEKFKKNNDDDDDDDRYTKMWTDLQCGKSSENETTNVLKKLLKIDNSEKSSSSSTTTTTTTTTGVIEDPVKSFFDGMISTMGKKTGKSPSVPIHHHSTIMAENDNQKSKFNYMDQLNNYCLNNNIRIPNLNFKYVGSKHVVGEILWSNGKLYNSQLCDNKYDASEMVAKEILKSLNYGKEKMGKDDVTIFSRDGDRVSHDGGVGERRRRINQWKGTKFNDSSDDFHRDHEEYKIFKKKNDFLPHELPQPPRQWVAKSAISKSTHLNFPKNESVVKNFGKKTETEVNKMMLNYFK